ncbi:hypothetical protein SADUNF_Sadunf06G0021100 [Salix dunnii]|uniref:Uncharacterized protein n=1 Tax=Salix dunnii TaxID=1413687 RepID=A0A835K203_9ROSI|nr:hypothetical protein SADUNF_Sadunf06G0021100 [Salix dunnii]
MSNTRMQKGTHASPSTGLRDKTSKKRMKVESKVARCVKSEPMKVLARESKMGLGVCTAKDTFDNDDEVEIIEKEGEKARNAGDVCNKEAEQKTFTELDASLRPFAAAGDGKARVDGGSCSVVLPPCAVPVMGTELIEGSASDPLPSDSEGDNDYPADYWLETFPKMLQGIPGNSLQEEKIEMIPNRFYFDYLL